MCLYRKAAFLSLAFVFANFCFGHASAQVITGYDKVAWDSALSDVRKAYSNLVEKTDAEEKAENIKRFRQDKPENLMTYREFYFYNDKLFKVCAYYDDLESKQASSSLLDKFTQTFGKFNSVIDGEFPIGNGTYYVGYTDYYRNYNPNLQIKVRLASMMHSKTQAIYSSFVSFECYNPVTEDALKKNLQEEN
jgi:hypothetical protein